MTTQKSTPSKSTKQPKVSHPGMMGDGTEEQNLSERGDPSVRISKKDVESAFSKQPKDRAK